jgi:hypothetical protein
MIRKLAIHASAPDIGLPGWTLLSWTLAGGIMVGGGLVLVMQTLGMVDPLRAGSLADFLFFFGIALGAVHGGILGMVGRPRDRSLAWAVRSEAIGLGLAIPAAAAAFWVNHVIAETPAVQALGGTGAIAGTGIIWGVGAAIGLMAAVEGYHALRNAYERWPDWKVGTGLLVLLVCVLGVGFLRAEPALWGTDINVSGPGALVLALGATLWLGAPAIVVALQVAHRLHREKTG